MSTLRSVNADERTMAVANAANTWGLSFISIALLIDIMYRALFLGEAAWDLFALLFASGAISILYMAHHKALGKGFGWKSVIIILVAAFIAAIVGAGLTMTKVM